MHFYYFNYHFYIRSKVIIIMMMLMTQNFCPLNLIVQYRMMQLAGAKVSVMPCIFRIMYAGMRIAICNLFFCSVTQEIKNVKKGIGGSVRINLTISSMFSALIAYMVSIHLAICYFSHAWCTSKVYSLCRIYITFWILFQSSKI